jgi:hypothetical protein
MMLMESRNLALVFLGCATLAVVADPATNPPRRSPVTNLAAWKDGVPAALPGARHPEVKGVYPYRPAFQCTYSHHSSLTFFQGRFFAIWSNGHTNEDDLGQRVLLSTSEDFDHWTEPRPLLISLSRDGARFGKHHIIGGEHNSHRRPGHAKGGEYGYPTSLVHEGWLYVIVSRHKEAVQVLRVRVSQLDLYLLAEHLHLKDLVHISTAGDLANGSSPCVETSLGIGRGSYQGRLRRLR